MLDQLSLLKSPLEQHPPYERHGQHKLPERRLNGVGFIPPIPFPCAGVIHCDGWISLPFQSCKMDAAEQQAIPALCSDSHLAPACISSRPETFIQQGSMRTTNG